MNQNTLDEPTEEIFVSVFCLPKIYATFCWDSSFFRRPKGPESIRRKGRPMKIIKGQYLTLGVEPKEVVVVVGADDTTACVS